MKNEVRIQHGDNKVMHLDQASLSSDKLMKDIQDLVQSGVNRSKELAQVLKSEKQLEIVIEPNLKRGIHSGKYSRDKGSLRIRDSKTKKFVDSAELVEKDKELLSKVSNNIVALVGQAQLAEISAKLDTINEKIDLLARFAWNEKLSDFQGLKITIEKASESLPSELAISRINRAIEKLHTFVIFFRTTMEDILNKEVKMNVIESFKEGLKFWEMMNTDKEEYNTKYSRDIQKIINEYGILFDLYSQSIGLLAVCYQVTNETHHVEKYLNKLNADTQFYKNELISKLGYLLDVKDLALLEEDAIFNLKRNLSDRKINNGLMSELTQMSEKVIEAEVLHDALVNQFKYLELTVDMNVIHQLEVR